jgi:hypothetical protein
VCSSSWTWSSGAASAAATTRLRAGRRLADHSRPRSSTPSATPSTRRGRRGRRRGRRSEEKATAPPQFWRATAEAGNKPRQQAVGVAERRRREAGVVRPRHSGYASSTGSSSESSTSSSSNGFSCSSASTTDTESTARRRRGCRRRNHQSQPTPTWQQRNPKPAKGRVRACRASPERGSGYGAHHHNHRPPGRCLRRRRQPSRAPSRLCSPPCGSNGSPRLRPSPRSHRNQSRHLHRHRR